MKAQILALSISAIFVLLLVNYHEASSQLPTPVLNARDDNAQTNEDSTVTIDVMENDDFVGLNPSVNIVTQPSHGQAVKVGNMIKYTPNENYFGSDSFTYGLSNGLLSDTATVSITVSPVNDPPVAVDDSATTDEDVSVVINALENDSDIDNDQLTIVFTTQPNNGTAVLTGTSVQYEPSPDFNGQDSFTYTVSDGNGGQDTATVSITVNPVADFFIIKTQSGLVGFDPLNNETQTRQELEAEQGFWNYGGSALNPQVFNPPAPTDLFKNSSGLHLGVESTETGKYAGFYAVTGPADAKLFHAVITTPIRTISENNVFFQNGLYVQTWDGRINYVTCVSITSTAGTSWHIIRTFGDVNQATFFEVLWSDPGANQPLTRDCTIITNGVDYLKVYLDGVDVYTNNMIDLQMPGPFLYFLEPQNPGLEMYYGIYNDFYMTKDETIKLVDAPIDAQRVDVVDSSGNVLASVPISNGTATLDVGMHHFPLAANIVVYDTNNMEIVSTSAGIYGGDEYAIIQQ